MQVAAGSGETGDAAPAVETAPSEERVAPKRFYSIEAAAKHWAAPMGIVMRPGGYLHSSSADTYQDLPEWLRGIKGGLSEQIHRLYRRGSGSVCGWAQLGMILLDKDLIYTTIGPRGARQFYVRS